MILLKYIIDKVKNISGMKTINMNCFRFINLSMFGQNKNMLLAKNIMNNDIKTEIEKNLMFEMFFQLLSSASFIAFLLAL